MDREAVADVVSKYQQAKNLRSPNDQQFRMNAAYCLPRDYAYWQGATSGTEQNRTSADAQARFTYDNTGVKAVAKYGAICKRLINPDNIKYHKLASDDDALMRVPQVRVYFEELTDKLFKLRSNPFAGFGSAQQEMYTSVGVYGTGPKGITWNKEYNTFRYKAWPLYNIYFLVDDEGRVTDVFRRFCLTKRQFEMRYPNKALPSKLKNVQSTDIYTTVECVHYVWKRKNDYDPQALSSKRMKWGSSYVCVDDLSYINAEEEGYLTCPYTLARTATTAGNPYGYSPAEMAFPALGSVNAMKKTHIKMGHKALDPPMLAYDDGVLSGRIDMRPGRVTYGGVNSSGQSLVREMQTSANFSVAETLVMDERKDIDDIFLVRLFEILTETPEMTAAQVYERVAEKAALFAPTMASLREEDQGPQIERELGLMVENGAMPPPPPELIEARGQYKVVYTNPMNNALHATEVAGFARWYETLAKGAQLSGNPEPLDWVNWDVVAPDLGDKMDVRAAWVNTSDTVKALRDKRNKQMEQQQLVNAAPAIASVAATASKQGALQ